MYAIRSYYGDLGTGLLAIGAEAHLQRHRLSLRGGTAALAGPTGKLDDVGAILGHQGQQALETYQLLVDPLRKAVLRGRTPLPAFHQHRQRAGEAGIVAQVGDAQGAPVHGLLEVMDLPLVALGRQAGLLGCSYNFV